MDFTNDDFYEDVTHLNYNAMLDFDHHTYMTKTGSYPAWGYYWKNGNETYTPHGKKLEDANVKNLLNGKKFYIDLI